MKQKQAYGLLAWGILFAFCTMMIVKDTHYLFHHHHCCCANPEAICVLDGEPLDCHHHHDHTSFLALDNSDDDCAICHFQVVKISKPSLTAYLCPAVTIWKVEAIPVIRYYFVSFVSITLRGPPVC